MTTKPARLDIRSWTEEPYADLPDGRCLKQAEVSLAGGGDGVALETTWRALLYYAADGTSTFVAVMNATGTLDGRPGGFVLTGRGGYDGATARMSLEIVPGSGTGDLAGIVGGAEHTSTHADYPQFPLTLTYTLP